MGTVHVYKNDDYSYDDIKKSVYSCLENSSVSQRLFDGAVVFIKANLLMKKSPEEAVTTHPSVIRAIADFFIEKKCKVVIGDSPAGPFSQAALTTIYSACEMNAAAELSGAALNFDVGSSEVYNEKALRLKRFDVINAVINADFVISAAKLKTHGMMTYTGAVKNLFGVIPGLIKAEYHFKLLKEEHFAEHLIDIEQYVKPDYSIIDAVECMEGNGPSNGIKRKVGLIIGSDNPYEADFAASKIASIPFDRIPTLWMAEKRNLFDKDSIEFTGDDLSDMDISPFILPDSVDISFLPGYIPRSLRNGIISRLKAKPEFIHSRCISCGHCVRSCPANVIKMRENKPEVDLSGCISCFCCHEVCPVDAINIKRPLLARLIRK